MSVTIDELKAVLNEFCGDIDAVGGLAKNEHDFYGPASDPEWTDLGTTYKNACHLLGRTPKYQEDDDGESEFDSDLDRPDPDGSDTTGEFELPKE